VICAFGKEDASSEEMVVKFGKAISWLKGTLQRCLFRNLEECWNTTLTKRERQLVSILELVQVEGFVLRKADNKRLGRKVRERTPIARSFVAKSVYGYPFTIRLQVICETDTRSGCKTVFPC
jgi:hypothetical protein